MSAEDVAARLSGIAEELADLAIDLLREAQAEVRGGGEPDPALMAQERRVTRARRAVDKAVQLLQGAEARAGVGDEGAD
ncbi:MAG TPA: hypothetical protein VMU09_07430 [Acidimicrobiales bacterium]|nr:hypothetical protein [Acidimicrobiales bacterium]